MQGRSIKELLHEAESLRTHFGADAFSEAGRRLASAQLCKDASAVGRWMAVADVLRGSDAADQRLLADRALA